MTPVLITGPALEPVSLAEMKLWLRVSTNDDDELISGLITAARLVLEADVRLLFVEQTWRISEDQWPNCEWYKLPLSPLRVLGQIRIFDANNVAATLSPAIYLLDPSPMAARIVFQNAPPQPGRRIAGIEIIATFGFGATPQQVPEPIRLATKMLAARWYENRGDAAVDGASLERLAANLNRNLGSGIPKTRQIRFNPPAGASLETCDAA